MLLEVINAIVALCLVGICGKYMFHLWNLRSYPPGPFPLPVIGNIHSTLSQPLQIWAAKMAKKYGSVFSASFGMERIVFINTIDPTIDTLIKKSTNFSGRPTNHYFIELFSRGFNNITFSDYGEMWRNRRKLGHTALNMLNDDNGNVESKILRESEEMHLRICKKEGEPVDIRKELGTSIINIMFNMLFNIRYNPDDKELVDIMSMNNQVISSFTFNDPTAWMKWLRHVYPTKNYLLVKDAIAKRDKYLSKYLKEHFQTYKEGVKRDFTDYLIELSHHNEHASIASESDLEMILTDMIFAGTESTMTALQWMVVYLMHWPEYQDRLLNDILKNTETGRYPCLKDKPKLHFVQAFTHEALRFSSFVPMCPPHKTMADEKVDSFVIPEGTTVFYNIWAIHQQDEHFPYPTKFNPDRWLGKDGHFQNSKSFMIFSVGKRVCLGETSARTQMFLFLTRLIRDFKILPEPDVPLPELGGVIALGISPTPFKVIFRSRT